MAARNKIIKFLNDYLEIEKWPDDYHNGLLASGKNEVEKIVTGVTPSIELFKKGLEAKADMIVAHHFLFADDKKNEVPGYELNRLKFLKNNDLNFANYHLPLDLNERIGNEVLTAKQFGFVFGGLKFYLDGYFIGGSLDEKTNVKELSIIAKKLYGSDPIVLNFGPQEISNVAIISGSGHGDLETVFKQGARTLITGCLKVESLDVAKELGLNVIACGHHNTEKVGIKALGDLVAKEFGINHEFIDIPNPI